MKRVFLILMIMSIAAGCGTNAFEGLEDKNTDEAEKFEITMRLNQGEYQWILDNPGEVNAIDYSAAAIGAAGLDPAGFLNALNDIAEQALQNDLSAVTTIPINPAYLDELQTAKDRLEEELRANPTDQDLNFQMVLTSITSTITAIVQVGKENKDSIVGGFDASDGIDAAEAEALGDFIANNPTVQIDTDGNDSPDTDLADLVAEDVGNAIGALQYTNMGDSELNQVLTDITQGPGSLDYDGNGTVTSTDISDYLINVLGQ